MSIEPTQALMDAVDALIRALDNDQHYFGDEYLAVKHAQAVARNVRATHSAPAGEPVAVIYIQFSTNGAIRKMSLKPFDGGVKYVPAFHPSWDNPDGPGAA